MGFQAQLLFWHHQSQVFRCDSSSISSHGFAWTWTLECLGKKKHPFWQTEKWWKKWRLFRKESVEFHVVGDLDLKVFLDRSTISRTSRKRVEFDGHQWKMDCWGSYDIYEHVAVVLLRNNLAWGHQPTLCCIRKNSFWVLSVKKLLIECWSCPVPIFASSKFQIEAEVLWGRPLAGVYLSKP